MSRRSPWTESFRAVFEEERRRSFTASVLPPSSSRAVSSPSDREPSGGNVRAVGPNCLAASSNGCHPIVDIPAPTRIEARAEREQLHAGLPAEAQCGRKPARWQPLLQARLLASGL
jgi:hypothetical protein